MIKIIKNKNRNKQKNKNKKQKQLIFFLISRVLNFFNYKKKELYNMVIVLFVFITQSIIILIKKYQYKVKINKNIIKNKIN